MPDWKDLATRGSTRFHKLVKVCEDYSESNHRLIALIQEAEAQRDLAVAHDRQPYPTAHAYEHVCKARDEWKALAKRLYQALAEKEYDQELEEHRWCSQCEMPSSSDGHALGCTTGDAFDAYTLKADS